MNSKIKRLAIISMLTAVAVVLSYLESFIPVFIPGVKLGLANVIIIIMLYEFKAYEAFTTNLLRILIVALIRGTLLTPTFLMSLSGGMVSFLFMLMMSRIKLFSPIATGIVGGFTHSLGQIIVAIIIMGTSAIAYYLPFIGLLSIATGVLTGVIAYTYLKRSITERFIEIRAKNSKKVNND